MKKITEHQNGTYTLNNLTFDELQIICSACVDCQGTCQNKVSEYYGIEEGALPWGVQAISLP